LFFGLGIVLVVDLQGLLMYNKSWAQQELPEEYHQFTEVQSNP